MKGIVFVEFIEMIENDFSIEMSDRLIEMSDLPSNGIYTSVGTYAPEEMITLVGNLSALTGTPSSTPTPRHPTAMTGVTSTT